MKSRIQKIVSWIKEHKKTSVVLLLVLVFIGYSAFKKSVQTTQDLTVVKGTVTQEVAVTGKTVAVHDLSIGFDKTGRVGAAYVDVGAKVHAGDTLVVLENADLLAKVAEARANLLQEQVKLAQTKQNSSGTYSDARANMISKIRDGYAKSDNAIHRSVDQFFKNPKTSNAYIVFSFTDGGTQYNFPVDGVLGSKVNSERFTVEKTLTAWQASLAKLSSNTTDLNSFIDEAGKNLDIIKSFLDDVALVANSITSSEFKYDATISGYKSTISDARSDVALAITNLISAREKLTSAPQQVSTGAGVDFDSVLSQEARVAQFKAALDSAQADLAKATIVSPIDGTVTKQDGKVGETVTAGDKIVSVISQDNLEIEANVSEVNIGKLTVGNKVQMTFDAFGDKAYTGTVTYIDPGETIVDNVVNYKTKVKIDGDVTGIKSGLTANLKIETAKKDDILKLPRYTIVEKNGKSYVDKVVSKDKTEQVEVTLGLSGNDGSVEVVSGVAEGDTVRADIKP